METDKCFDKSLKPPFCRQGNKYMSRRQILKWFPTDIPVYVELFAGSGAIFFNKEDKSRRNILNDLDKNVIDRFRLLKKAPGGDTGWRNDLNTLAKIKRFFSDHGSSIQDKILFEKIRTCNGFSGKPVTKPEEIYRSYNPISILGDLADYKDMLTGVVLTNKDYSDIVDKYDGVGTFFFIDPPYEGTQKSHGYSSGSNDFDYERLCDVLRGIRGHFLMTMNDSSRIRSLFKGFHIVPLEVYTTWGNSSGGQEKRKELIIMNY